MEGIKSSLSECQEPTGNTNSREKKFILTMTTTRGTSITGKLLLALLMSNVLLVRKVVLSNPICTPGSLQCQVLLSDLFDRAIRLSHYIHSLSSEMFENFMTELKGFNEGLVKCVTIEGIRQNFQCNRKDRGASRVSRQQHWNKDQQYAQGRHFIAKGMNNCHTSTLRTPEDKDQTLQLRHEDLLSLVNKLLQAWSQPLHHMTMEAPDNLVQKLREAEEQTRTLQGGIDRISGRMLINLDDFYPQALGPVDVIVPQGESPLYSTYHLLHCFRRDSHKIDSYLKILRCRMIHANNC